MHAQRGRTARPTSRTYRFSVALFLVTAALFPLEAAEAPQTKSLPPASSISFSKSHGFYDVPISIALAATNATEIRYTLDGTLPSKTRGTIYEKPIDIRQTTVVRAVAIDIGGKALPVKTQTYLFPADVVRQSPDGNAPPNFPARWGRARVDYGMDPRIVDAPANRDQMIPALKSLPSFSLVMDPEDLFGETRGLYSNPEREGRAAERPASLELLFPDGRPGFQIICGTRIRGGVSTWKTNPKHAFRFFFRKEYGAGNLKYPVFGTNAAKTLDAFDLRCAQNHSWHMENEAECLFVRDQFNRDLQLAIGQPGARGDFFHLYLNGQYWGLYNSCERPEASYAASYFGGQDKDYDVIKTHGLGADQRKTFTVTATDGDEAAWRRLHTLAGGNLADNAAYFRLLGKNTDGSNNPKGEVLLDPTNLIDYMLLIFYAGNYDAPVTKFFGNTEVNNFHAIRRRNGREGFRFFIWDAEHTLMDLFENRLGPFPTGAQYSKFNPQWLWQQCLANSEFKVLVTDRIQKHFFGEGALTPKATRALFDRRIQEIEAAVLCESARWGDSHPGRPLERGISSNRRRVPFTRDDWRAEVKRMREIHLPRRSGIVLRQMQQAGLVARVSAPQIAVASTNATQMTLKLTAEKGQVIYTTDGSDPRAIGGAVASTVQTAFGPITVSAGSLVRARAKSSDGWSAMVETKTVQP